MKERESGRESETNNAPKLLATLTVYHGDAQKEERHAEHRPGAVPTALALDSSALRG